jgi:transglutaminase-like putative cysteine protease
MKPKVIEWARSRWVAAGAVEEDEFTARALLDAIRREKFYIPDPVDGEFIPEPECMLADCDGVSFDAGDCDDLAAAYAAALESIGITCCIIGQGFDESGSIQHVLVGVEVRPGIWMYADPTENYPLGEANKPTREYWVSLPGGTTLCDARPSCIKLMQGKKSPKLERTEGDYVGLGFTGEPVVEPEDPHADPYKSGNTAATFLGLAIGLATGIIVTALIKD